MNPWSTCTTLSFGLFGTLVDRWRGLAAALGEVGGITHPAQIERLLAEQGNAQWEVIEELDEFVPFREVLVQSLLKAAAVSGTLLPRSAAERVADSAPDWPLYDDAVPALERLAGRYRLVLVSNYDRPIVEGMAKRLKAPFARLVTSTDLEAYKPEPDLMLAVLHELELDEEHLMHVGSDPEQDLYTAEDLSIKACYVDRDGAGLPEELTVTLTVPSLGRLANLLVEAPAAPRRRPGGPPARPGRGPVAGPKRPR